MKSTIYALQSYRWLAVRKITAEFRKANFESEHAQIYHMRHNSSTVSTDFTLGSTNQFLSKSLLLCQRMLSVNHCYYKFYLKVYPYPPICLCINLPFFRLQTLFQCHLCFLLDGSFCDIKEMGIALWNFRNFFILTATVRPESFFITFSLSYLNISTCHFSLKFFEYVWEGGFRDSHVSKVILWPPLILFSKSRLISWDRLFLEETLYF